MTPLTHLHNNVHGIEVPEDAEADEWLIITVDGTHYLNGMTTDGEMYAGTEPLPPGNWTILFCTKGCTEEQAAQVVGDTLFYDNGGLKDENGIDKLWEPWTESDWPYETATESLASLLRSKGLDPKKNILILKKESHA